MKSDRAPQNTSKEPTHIPQILSSKQVAFDFFFFCPTKYFCNPTFFPVMIQEPMFSDIILDQHSQSVELSHVVPNDAPCFFIILTDSRRTSCCVA